MSHIIDAVFSRCGSVDAPACVLALNTRTKVPARDRLYLEMAQSAITTAAVAAPATTAISSLSGRSYQETCAFAVFELLCGTTPQHRTIHTSGLACRERFEVAPEV